MRRWQLFGLVVGSWLIALARPAIARQADQETATIEPVLLAVDAPISEVTLYMGRASIRRVVELNLPQGLHELRFGQLAQTLQPETLQASATGGARVLSVEIATQAAEQAQTPEIRELDQQIEAIQQELKDNAAQHDLLRANESFLDAIAARIAGDTAAATGSKTLDLEALRSQMAFVEKERQKIMQERRQRDQEKNHIEKRLAVAQSQREMAAGRSGTNQVATVLVAAPQALQTTVELSYLVTEATWAAAYNVRAMSETDSASIEYDAMLSQRTGEHWNNVKLTLSTAQPTVAANPPTLQPWHVDIRRSPAPASVSADRGRAPPAPAREPEAALEQMSKDAAVGGGGPSVTFALPRTVTVETHALRQQRTRIATIDSKPQFVHVAVPALTEAVYVRADLLNDSPYQLLPGRASVFVGQDYVGPTTMTSVAPGSRLRMHFGIDRAIKATRQLVSKNTETTGLLGGGRRTDYAYRLLIDNGSGKPVTVELWDRFPVSLNEEIQVELRDLSDSLASDEPYLSEERPQGLLKWMLNVPAGATDNQARIITYGVRIDRAKDVEMTELPE